ncbi:MAG: hypothetical protein NZ703_14555, partial [Gemmataceae bacterium]|nr:hypothetical protein [Gemmataceae bacterium]
MSELCMVVVPRHRKPQAGPVLLPRLAMMVFVVVACVFFGGRQSLQGQLQADEGTVVAKSSQSQFKTESQEGKVIAPADQKPKLPVRLLLKGKTEYTLDTGTLSPA